MRTRLVLACLLSCLISSSGSNALEEPAGHVSGAVPSAKNRVSAAGLGPWAVDEHGQGGRIHMVVPGDTLWDISALYLGTPWVWPSVWRENEEISNPHLILPGDRIWITAGEMRKITRERADQMIAAAEARVGEVKSRSEEPAPVLPPQKAVRVAELEAMGFVTSDAVAAATSVVESPSPREWLAEGDLVYLGMGRGQVEVGDEFTLFRDAQAIRDVGSAELLGYHVNILGWLVVREVVGDSSIAEIRSSRSEIRRGDRMIPREPVAREVIARATGQGAEGNIVFMPDARSHVADGDYVYLNRGFRHGFGLGSEVEVYTPGRLGFDRVSGKQVRTPDLIRARLVLVEVKRGTSVAFVTFANDVLEVGDRIRPTPARVVSR